MSSNEDSTFWFPTGWTAVGTVLTGAAFLLSLLLALKPYLFPSSKLYNTLSQAKGDVAAIQVNLEAVATNVDVLTKAAVPPGEPDAETLREIFLSLRSELRGMTKELQGSRTDVQALVPAILEISSSVKLLMKDGLKIQRVPGQLSSVNSINRAPAESLARERIRRYFQVSSSGRD